MFTSIPISLQLCLNGEPILSLQPDINDSRTNIVTSQGLKEERYIIRRLHHSIGEVTCVSIDEYISLPPDAALSVRYHSQSVAQAFFSIKKL